MNKENIQNLIDNYLDGKLSGSDLTKFESHLSANHELKNMVKLEQESRLIIKIAGRKKLKEKLEGFEKGVLDSDSNLRKLSPGKIFARIAAAVLLISIPIYLFISQPTDKHQDNFANVYEPYRAPDNVRGIDDESNALWLEAVESYSNKEFTKASESFQNLLESKNSYLIRFYYGVSELFDDQSDLTKSIESLKMVLQSDNDYHQQAEWYLSYAYFKNNQKEEAQRILTRIVNKPDHYKNKEAQALLKK